MSFIILIRMNSGDLWTIEISEEYRIEEFESYEDAKTWIEESALKSQDWEIIEVEI